MAPPAKEGKKPQTFDAQPASVKIFAGVFLLAIIGAIYYFGLHMTLSDSLESAENDYQALLIAKTEAEQRQGEFLRLTQELAGREGVDRQNKRVLPEKAEIAAFLDDLNRLAELNGLRIGRVEPRPEEAQEMLVKIPVALQLQGRFHEVSKFFHNVSGLERAINMENVELTEPELQGEDFVLTIDVLATTFRRPTAEELAGEPADGQVPPP